jgi:hypothetical protein
MPTDDPNFSDARHQAGPDPTDENEVDRVLAEAAGLSGRLGSELGTEPSESGPGADLGALAAQATEADVDDQLNKVEELLKGIRPDLEAEEERPQGDEEVSAEPADTEEPPASATPVQTDSDTVEAPRPDDPDAEDESLTDGEPSEDLDDRPFSADTNTETSLEPAGVPDLSHQVLESDSAVQQDSSDAPVASSGRLSGSASGGFLNAAGVRRALTAALGAIGNGFLVFCDLLDNMFAWVSYDARRIIGWVALALLVAACSIAAYSLS